MADDSTTIEELKKKVSKFNKDRDWDQFHNAKELAIDIIGESAELLEHFRFKSEREVKEIMENPIKSQKVKQEMADVAIGLLRIAQIYKIDLSKEIEDKLIEAGKKYPVEKSKGKNKKYDEL